MAVIRADNKRNMYQICQTFFYIKIEKKSILDLRQRLNMIYRKLRDIFVFHNLIEN